MAETKTPNLDMTVVEPTDFYNYQTQQKDNFEKIDTFIGGKPSTLKTISKKITGSLNELFDKITTLGTDKLDKGANLKATSAKQLEEQIEKLEIDYIIETGGSIDAGGIYRKWNSGYLELFGEVRVEALEGTVRFSHNFINSDYVVTVNVNSATNATTSFSIINNSSVVVRSNGTFYKSWTAKGFWK